MSWEAIGALAEALGAFAVVLSVLYLATQIRRDHEATTANTTQMRQNGTRETMLAIATSTELVSTLAEVGWGSAPQVDVLVNTYGIEKVNAIRLNALFTSMIRQSDANLRMPQTKNERSVTLKALSNMISGDNAMAVWWKEAKTGFDPEFVNEVENFIGGDT